MIWKHKINHILRIALLVFFISNYGPELSSANNAAEKQPVQLQSTERVKKYIYKQTPQGELVMYVHFPKDWTVDDKRPAIVFFFGGGWSEGTVKQFVPQAEYLAGRGMVTVRADYRVRDRHGTTPDKCVEDGKSAVRWLRANAAKLGIDPNRIAASGHSAGGHIAVCTYTTKGLEAKGEDPSVSSKPNLLVMFEAGGLHFVPGMRPDVGVEMAIKISPYKNLSKEVPPAFLYYGTEDQCLVLGGLDFIEKSKKLGTIVELYTAEGQTHWSFQTSPWLERTIYLVDKFLARYGYTQGEPTMKLPEGKVEMKNMSRINLYAYAKDKWGHTTLHRAARHGHKESVELLIAQGADVNSKDSWGSTPLFPAVWHAHKELVEVLIANGADVNAKDNKFGFTPLFVAGLNDVAELLIARGADVNAKDKRGDTPLHRAAYRGYKERVELLIAKGADVNAKTEKGQTAISLANNKGHTEIVELLKKHTANPMSTTKGPKSVLLSPSDESGMDEVCDLILDSPVPGKQNFGWDPACGDVNGDGYDDVVATAAAWDNGARRGRVYLYYGGQNMDAIPDKIFTGEAKGDYFGDGCGVGDVNGDGYDDVLVGAPCFSGGAEDGRVYVFHGGPAMDEKADLILEGESGTGGYYGIDIGVGDVNRDDYDDVVVTAVKMNSWKGRAYLYYGGNPMDSTCDLIFEGENENDAFGRTVFLGDGDVNGDHYPDLLIQAKQYPGGKNRGRIYLYYGGDPMDNICDKTFTGENDRDEFGEGNCLIDVDDDGFCDVIIGADCWPAREKIQGRVYLYWGSKDMDVHADKTFTGELGAALSVVYGGYFNNDEYGDILTGAWGYKHFDLRGQAHIYHGSIQGQMDEFADSIFNNDAPKSRFGMRLTAGDVNGDGYDDAIINGFGYNSQQGRIWLYYGGPDK